MRHLNIDLETFSSVDIMKSGLYRYVQSPDFQILLLAYSLDGGPVQVLDFTAGDSIDLTLQNLLFDKTVIKHAYNASFEWYCLSKFYNLSNPEKWLSEWRCTMLHGLYCGYTAGLAATGTALGLPDDKKKMSVGKALIRTFCTPCKPSKSNGFRTRTLPHHEPEKWNLFKEYNRQDVVTEMEIEHRLSYFPVPDSVQQEWMTDQIINARGVAVDHDLISGALWCSEKVTGELTAEAVQLTGLNNPNSVAQLSEWLTEETGEEVADLRKDTVKAMLSADMDSDTARRVLEIRQELSKTSVKKYTAMQEVVCPDGRVRGLLQFYGANRTGRWAGRLVQVQNLPQTHLDPLPLARDLTRQKKPEQLRLLYGSVPSTLSQLIRTALVPAPGMAFVDADFSAIEARVIAWLAGEDWVLEVFKGHGKIYEATASQMFGTPLELIAKGNPEYALRQKGKVATLALGYGGGVGALIAMKALQMGLTEEELPDIVSRWRSANPRIKDLWYKVQNAAIDTTKTGKQNGVNGLLFSLEGGSGGRSADGLPIAWHSYLTITLPNGRKLFYVNPFLTPGMYGDTLNYWGMDQTTKKWRTIDTWGGKLVENIVQAIARDCLAVNIERLETVGYPVVFHVHDEVILEVPTEKAHLKEVCSIMSQPIPWAPGLPLKAEGWVGEFYTKD